MLATVFASSKPVIDILSSLLQAYVKRQRWEESEAVRKDPKMKLSQCFLDTFDKCKVHSRVSS